ncbi:MAG: hypothetical protein KBD06_05040 [Candidatus Pacebacteria bacterium]|nr:hypothetical protein [Candidatus Paceibacterota bacterium]
MNTRHSVLLTVIAALVLVVAGLYFVQRQRAVSPTGGGASWETAGGYIEPTVTPIENEPEPFMPDVSTQTGPETLNIPKGMASSTVVATTKENDESFDYNALLARLSHDSETAPAAQATKTYEQLLEAFTFTPNLSTPAPKVRTPQQEALFAYGNEIGRRVKGFAAVNPNMAQTVVNQATHRDNTAYGDAVRELGKRYKALGEGILAIEGVPTAAASQHKALGEGYLNLGTALSAVPDATDDQAFLSAITTYNNKADAFTISFVGMVTLFSSLEVEFDESDGGSAFSFRR